MNFTQVYELKSKMEERQQSNMYEEGKDKKRERRRCESLAAGIGSPLSPQIQSHIFQTLPHPLCPTNQKNKASQSIILPAHSSSYAGE